MFPVNGSLRTAPLFPRSGPGESGSPMSQVLLRRYDFPPRISGHLFASLPGSARSSSFRVSQLALPVGRRAHKNIQHTVRYTELAPHRFKDFWRRSIGDRGIDL